MDHQNESEKTTENDKNDEVVKDARSEIQKKIEAAKRKLEETIVEKKSVESNANAQTIQEKVTPSENNVEEKGEKDQNQPADKEDKKDTEEVSNEINSEANNPKNEEDVNS